MSEGTGKEEGTGLGQAPVEGASEQPKELEIGFEVEGEGETVGEAKWAALRELERRWPGLERSSVDFTVLSEGERCLLGVGFVPARVIAKVISPPRWAEPVPVEVSYPPGTAPHRLREFLEHVCAALAVGASVTVQERDEALTAVLYGSDLGLVIGKHGQTIDAIQYLANALTFRGEESRKEIVVDAAGYRARRRATLEAIADRAAARVLEVGEIVRLEPMTAAERKIVHIRLKERAGVATASEGAEPNRVVVVRPTE